MDRRNPFLFLSQAQAAEVVGGNFALREFEKRMIQTQIRTKFLHLVAEVNENHFRSQRATQRKTFSYLNVNFFICKSISAQKSWDILTE